MEEEVPSGPDGAERSGPADGIPPLPAELASTEEEVRALVEAGAATPEELRALAAKLQEKRAYEESLWRSEVKPALIKSKKRRLQLGDLHDEVVDPEIAKRSNAAGLAVLLLVAVLLLLLIATQTSFLWLFLPVAGVLVYAWVQGRAQGTTESPSAPPDAAD